MQAGLTPMTPRGTTTRRLMFYTLEHTGEPKGVAARSKPLP